MSISLQSYDLETLTVEDRLALAEALWDSVSEIIDEPPLAPELSAELRRRVALADADPARGIPWDVVRAGARARWGRCGQGFGSPLPAGERG